MKFKIITSFLTSLIITIVIYFFSNSFILQNYSSSIEFKIDSKSLTTLSLNISTIAEGRNTNLNKFLTNEILIYLNETFLGNYNSVNRYILINNNEKCKIPKKFNKIPISISGKSKSEDKTSNYILKISYFMDDPQNIKICNDIIYNLLNDKIRDEVTILVKSHEEFLTFYFADKDYLKINNEPNNPKNTNIEQQEFSLLYYNLQRLKKAEEFLKKNNYFIINKKSLDENVLPQNKTIIYFFLIFLFLLVLIYSTLSGITKNYYKKITKYINY